MGVQRVGHDFMTENNNNNCVSSSPLALQKARLTGPQSHMFWGLTLPVQEPSVGLDHLLLRENLCDSNYPPIYRSSTQGFRP